MVNAKERLSYPRSTSSVHSFGGNRLTHTNSCEVFMRITSRFTNRITLIGHWRAADLSTAWCGQLGSRALEDEKISHTAMNIAAITGPITKPLRPKIAMPPRVAISTT